MAIHRRHIPIEVGVQNGEIMKNRIAKTIIATMIMLTLVVGVVPSAASAAETGNTYCSETNKHKITSKKINIVADVGMKEKITVYFVDGHTDIPYADIDETMELIGLRLSESEGYKLTKTVNDNVVEIRRETLYGATIDYEKNIIVFEDYNAFMKPSYNSTLLEAVTNDYNRDGVDYDIHREKGSVERYGDALIIDLGNYNINLIYQDGHYLMPIQTISDVFLSGRFGSLAYNSKNLYFCPTVTAGATNILTPLGEEYYSVKPKKRSAALAEFNYNELCLFLDLNYGLKENHHITSFYKLFFDTGLETRLKSRSAVVANKALQECIGGIFADLHSEFKANSPYAGYKKNTTPENNAGLVRQSFIDTYLDYYYARSDKWPEGIPSYMEIGDTAFVTFDNFIYGDANYYETAPTIDAVDTRGIIAYAHSKITRKNSPVKNVVLDLSCNLGGDVNAGAYVIGWMIGDCTVSLRDPLTGATATTVYRSDVNMDHKFDNNDSLYGKYNLYCMTSPASFSCGNFVPCTLASTSKVSIIGKSSAGGACTVLPASTADGTVFNVSCRYQLQVVRNGAFIDVESGAPVDTALTKMSSYFDREALVKLIDEAY